jgi:hypothetical protein
MESTGALFKFMKSKEDIKILMLHIVGLVVHLSATGNINLSFIAAKSSTPVAAYYGDNCRRRSLIRCIKVLVSRA